MTRRRGPSGGARILAGCAPLKSARGAPITDINLIVGKWVDTITPGSPGFDDCFYLTITLDRKPWRPGERTPRSAQATYEMEPMLVAGIGVGPS